MPLAGTAWPGLKVRGPSVFCFDMARSFFIDTLIKKRGLTIPSIKRRRSGIHTSARRRRALLLWILPGGGRVAGLSEVCILRDVLHLFNQQETGGKATFGAGRETIIFTKP